MAQVVDGGFFVMGWKCWATVIKVKKLICDSSNKWGWIFPACYVHSCIDPRIAILASHKGLMKV
jgi:hypothetical protein